MYIYIISDKGTATSDINNIYVRFISLPTGLLHFGLFSGTLDEKNLHFKHFRSNFFMERFQSGWLARLCSLPGSTQNRFGSCTHCTQRSVHSRWSGCPCTYGGCAVVYSLVPKGELSTATGSRTALLYCHRGAVLEWRVLGISKGKAADYNVQRGTYTSGLYR